MPPTKIELSGILSGTRLEVKENEEVELTCVVHDAKPKATVVWYRQNTEFYTGTFVCLPLQQQEGERENERTNEHRLPIPLACLMTFLPPSYLPSRIPPPSPVPTTHARAAAVASRGKK